MTAVATRPPLDFPRLSTAFEPPGPAVRPLRLCIVTRELYGPFRNGGIGTAYTHLAHFLTALGHDVTVYFSAAPAAELATLERWIDHYARRGIRFVPPAAPDPPPAGGPNSNATRVARAVHDWLREQDFDVVHVSEYRGDAYYALLAKAEGLAFEDTTFVVKASSPTLWCNLGNDKPITDIGATVTMYLERRSIELADWVVSPSQHMLRWMTEFGYALPERSYVQPNLVVPDWDAPLERFPPVGAEAGLLPVDELVFFGRLEWRKGLAIFCRALRIAQRRGHLRGVRVTFLGKASRETRAYVEDQSRDWDFEWSVVEDLDSDRAIAYLGRPGRLACIPSLVENSAFTIYESLLHGIPFIASDTGGNAELLHPDYREAVIFRREDPGALARRLAEVLHGGATLPRAAFDWDASRATWRDFHAHLAEPRRRPQQRSPRPAPRVSVCMTHFNRPRELAQAVDSVRALEYPDFELVLVDDGSDDPQALAQLEALAPEFGARDWQLVYQENRYLGAARNAAARRATGEYLLFMDDDNLAKPHELDVFVRVALRTGADILTCFVDSFTGDSPWAEGAQVMRDTPVGDCLASGIVKNVFGDANALIRRSTFEALGGFSEDYASGTQDYELFLKAVVEGHRLLVVPEALFWYRRGHERMSADADVMERGRLRAFRSVTAGVDGRLHLPLRLAQGSAMELTRLRARHQRLVEQVRALEQDHALLRRLLDD